MSYHNNPIVRRQEHYQSHIQQGRYNNKSKYNISPPIISSQQQQQQQEQFEPATTFYNHNSHRVTEDYCWDSVSTIEGSSFSSPSSPSSSSLSSCSSQNNMSHNNSSITSHNCRKRKKMSISSILNNDDAAPTSSSSSSFSFASFVNSCQRKKQKPIQSLPSSTRGAFSMPNFLLQPTNARSLLPSPIVHQSSSRINPSSMFGNSNYHCSQSPPHNAASSSTAAQFKKRKSQQQQQQQQLKNENYITSLPAEGYSALYMAKKKVNDHSDNHDNNYNRIYEQQKEQPMSYRVANIPPINNANQGNIASLNQNQDGSTEIAVNNDMEGQVEEDSQISKKAKTDAALIYDNLSADCDQSILFMNHEEWIPKLDVFDRRPMVRISWKGSPLKIKNMPYYEKLHPGEATIAATLRLTPEQYLKCKWALVLAAKEAHETNSLFRKSEAQKVCCIDVNKTSVLWNAFGKLGWLGPRWPQ